MLQLAENGENGCVLQPTLLRGSLFVTLIFCITTLNLLFVCVKINQNENTEKGHNKYSSTNVVN